MLHGNFLYFSSSAIVLYELLVKETHKETKKSILKVLTYTWIRIITVSDKLNGLIG